MSVVNLWKSANPDTILGQVLREYANRKSLNTLKFPWAAPPPAPQHWTLALPRAMRLVHCSSHCCGQQLWALSEIMMSQHTTRGWTSSLNGVQTTSCLLILRLKRWLLISGGPEQTTLQVPFWGWGCVKLVWTHQFLICLRRTGDVAVCVSKTIKGHKRSAFTLCVSCPGEQHMWLHLKGAVCTHCKSFPSGFILKLGACSSVVWVLWPLMHHSNMGLPNGACEREVWDRFHAFSSVLHHLWGSQSWFGNVFQSEQSFNVVSMYATTCGWWLCSPLSQWCSKSCLSWLQAQSAKWERVACFKLDSHFLTCHHWHWWGAKPPRQWLNSAKLQIWPSMPQQPKFYGSYIGMYSSTFWGLVTRTRDSYWIPQFLLRACLAALWAPGKRRPSGSWRLSRSWSLASLFQRCIL